MKKNTIIQFIVTGMFLFGATACTGNFEDYNKNPHEPDQNDMGVDWYLVRSLALNLQDLMMPEQENFSQYVDCLMAGAFSGYVADSNLGTGWSGRYATYNPSDDWKKIPFNDFYSKFYPDYFNLKNQSDDELFLSLAELYRIVVMLRVTDTYGPIPYSKVGAANAIKSPYDSQQAVYAKMLEDLDNIITVLGKFGNQSFSSSADRIYNGNTSAWYKFANSLKLRMAMRTCYVAGFNVNGKTSQQLAEEAVAAGAEFVGAEELIPKIQNEGWFDFDKVVATPNMMSVVGRLGRVLGPKGLMPNPKAGTVTMDVAKAVQDLKAGKIEYRLDKTNIIHVPIGKASFTEEQLNENFQTLIDAIIKAKPAAAKGQYIRSATLTSTMGPGVKLNPARF